MQLVSESNVHLPPPSRTPFQSFELRQFIKARTEYDDRCFARDDRGMEVASEALDDAILALMARPVRSWSDVLDLAEMVVAERWTADEHGLPDEQFCEGHRFNIERALLRAMLTFGGRCNG